MDLDDLREIATSPWRPVSAVAFSVSTGALAVFALVVASGGGWVPILDSVNLVFHEAGHPIVGLVSERLETYGGTLFQLLIPLLVMGSFWMRRDAIGCTAAGAWLSENLVNVARYMADARAQQLELVGGGEHDWFHIFIRWNVLGLDTRIASATRVLAWAGLSACWVFLAWRWRADRAEAIRPRAAVRGAARAPARAGTPSRH